MNAKKSNGANRGKNSGKKKVSIKRRVAEFANKALAFFRTGRYLKSISAKSFDGTSLKMPSCCVTCSLAYCRFPCKPYIEEMKTAKCSQFDMEFGVHETAGVILAKKSLSLSLIVGAVFLLSMLYRGKPNDRGYAASVVCNALPGTTGMVYTVSYNGPDIDTNKFADVVNASMSAGKRK